MYLLLQKQKKSIFISVVPCVVVVLQNVLFVLACLTEGTVMVNIDILN